MKQTLQELANRSGYNLYCPHERPQLIVRGNIHYTYSGLERDIIAECKPEIILSEDLVDSSYIGGKWQHGEFFSTASHNKKLDISTASVLLNDLDVIGIDHPTETDNTAREFHFFQQFLEYCGKHRLVYATVGGKHVEPGSDLRNFLRLSKLKEAVFWRR